MTAIRDGHDEQPDSVLPRVEQPRSRRLGRVCAALSCLIPVVFAIAEVAVHETHVTELSTIDEHIHVDYLFDLQHSHLPSRGDVFRQESMRAWVCRGHQAGVPGGLHCSDPTFNPDAFPLQLTDTYIYFPTYYALSVATYDIAQHFGAGDVIGWTRGLGMAWLAMGLAVTWFVLRELRFGYWARALALTAIALSPPLIVTSAIVNPSATALVSGAAALLTALWWERRAAPAWLFVGVCGLAIAFASTNVLGVGIAVLYLLASAYQRRRQPANARRRGSRETLIVCGAVALVTFALSVGWSVLVSVRATVSNDTIYGWARVSHFPWNEAIREFFHPRLPWGFTAAGGPEYARTVGPFKLSVLASAMGLVALFAFASLIFCAFRGASRRQRVLTASTLVGLFVFAFMWILLEYVTFHGNLGLVSRYTFSALPAIGVGIAALCSERAVRWVATPVFAFIAIFSLAALVAGPHLGAA